MDLEIMIKFGMKDSIGFIRRLFVHGSCVKNEETIKFFKKKIKENILNLAIVGNNGYNQIGTFKEYLKKITQKILYGLL